MLEIQLFMSYPTDYESLLARSEGLEPPTLRSEDKSVANAGVCDVYIDRWGMGWYR